MNVTGMRIGAAIRNILRGTILRSGIKIDLLAQQSRKKTKPRKQIQPELGVERAFGQALREIRSSQQISQERLALECSLDRSYISLIERGINSPSVRVVVKIAAILNVPASKIIGRMEDLLGKLKRARSRRRHLPSPGSRVIHRGMGSGLFEQSRGVR